MIPINHDHVGDLVFTASTAQCRKCGAAWILYERGWVCVTEGEAS